MGSCVYAPSIQAKLAPKIEAVLTDKWVNSAAVCTALHTYTGDPNVSYALNKLFGDGRIERKTEPSHRGRAKCTHFYRRAA